MVTFLLMGGPFPHHTPLRTGIAQIDTPEEIITTSFVVHARPPPPPVALLACGAGIPARADGECISGAVLANVALIAGLANNLSHAALAAMTGQPHSKGAAGSRWW